MNMRGMDDKAQLRGARHEDPQQRHGVRSARKAADNAHAGLEQLEVERQIGMRVRRYSTHERMIANIAIGFQQLPADFAEPLNSPGYPVDLKSQAQLWRNRADS